MLPTSAPDISYGRGPFRLAVGMSRPILKLLLILFGVITALWIVPGADAHAAPPPDGAIETTEASSGTIRIVVQTGGPLDAAGFADAHGPVLQTSMDELGTLFGVAQAPELVLYVYTDAVYYDLNATSLPASVLNPLGGAPDVAGGDLSLYLPFFLERTPLEAENVLRHGLARLLLGHVSGNHLPRGFSEGMAMYVERPVTPNHARYASLMSAAGQRGGLLSWSDLNRDSPPTNDTELVEAQSYAVVAFLVERYGLRSFRDMLAALAPEPDWRLAMRATYNRDPGEVEKQWRENVAEWAAGDWRTNVVAAFDLGPARELLARADYIGAKTRLEQSHRLFTDLGDQNRLAETDALLTQCEVGIQAETLMTQAQQALERHTYDRAITLVTQARTQYDELPPEQRPDDLLTEYTDLADQGLVATTRLDEAQRLSRRWSDYPEARDAAVAAGSTFATLGNVEMTERATSLVSDIDGRQQRIVLLLAALAALTGAWLLLWLWARGPGDLRWRT